MSLTNQKKLSLCDKFVGGFMCLGITGTLLSILGIYIYNIYYAIYALSEIGNNTIRETCPDSQIWMYVLISLICVNLTLLNQVCETKDDEFKENTIMASMCSMVCRFCVILIFAGWGWDQIWNSGNCLDENFSDQKLLIAARVSFYIQLGILSIFTVLFTVMLFFLCCNMDPPKKPVDNDQKLKGILVPNETPQV